MRRPLSRSTRRDRVTTRNNDNVARVLITGMSGIGKSSVLQELSRRGYRVVDTDYGDYHETADGERLWREDRIAALLAEDGPLFVQGTTRNQVVFYPHFDRRTTPSLYWS